MAADIAVTALRHCNWQHQSRRELYLLGIRQLPLPSGSVKCVLYPLLSFVFDCRRSLWTSSSSMYYPSHRWQPTLSCAKECQLDPIFQGGVMSVKLLVLDVTITATNGITWSTHLFCLFKIFFWTVARSVQTFDIPRMLLWKKHWSLEENYRFLCFSSSSALVIRSSDHKSLSFSFAQFQ